MMAVHCERLNREVIIWSSSILGTQETDYGMVVTYQCACGETAQLLTGKRAQREVTAHVSV